MREVNFSIPNANKASVGITPALYDRRALDCTSTLPLINSLNNLAYLTTSSGRIRDILTVDGGIERLVCILKEGRSKDMMEMWKWNLAFQCIVNIGVRGSEAVRRRVVEADMVPVIATILDNYFLVMEKCKERAELENLRRCPFAPAKNLVRSSEHASPHEQRGTRSRRHVPPPITIPEPPTHHEEQDDYANQITPTGTAANLSLSSPPERSTFAHSQSQQRARLPLAQQSPHRPASQRQAVDPPLSASITATNVGAMFGFRPVRESDRLPSMIPTLHTETSSRPQSPATPGGPNTSFMGLLNGARVPRRRPSIRQHLSISGSDDDGQVDEVDPEGDPVADAQVEPVIDIQADIVMRDLVDEDDVSVSEPPTTDVTLTVPDMSSTADETFNITHRSAADGSAVNAAATPTQVGQLPFPPAQLLPQINTVNATPPNLQQPLNWYGPRLASGVDRFAPSNVLAAMPRDEDVLMSLQLLAYVSKYCYLRSYFQQSHLVPRLKVGSDLNLLDLDYNPATQRSPTEEELLDEWDNEFVKKPEEKPFNIFPLIEKFTARPSSSKSSTAMSPDSRGDMQYWAGVVMRNLCRKDDTRGGIRQCAYWQCGKWEEYTRQFAKCRRCRRTKYCSKECQKGAWGSHRFWCVAADDGSHGEVGSSDRSGRRHHHHHHHHR